MAVVRQYLLHQSLLLLLLHRLPLSSVHHPLKARAVVASASQILGELSMSKLQPGSTEPFRHLGHTLESTVQRCQWTAPQLPHALPFDVGHTVA